MRDCAARTELQRLFKDLFLLAGARRGAWAQILLGKGVELSAEVGKQQEQ